MQSRTRAQIRPQIGYNLGAVYEGTASGNGAAGGTTVVDTGLLGGNDEYNGRWVIITSGDAIGEIRRISDYASGGTITVPTAFTAQILASVTYEIWAEAFPPAAIHQHMNQAVIRATGKAGDPEEDLSLHLHPGVRRYDLPTELAALSKLEYRRLVDSLQLSSLDTAWTAGTNTTVAADSEMVREGTACNKLTVAAAAGAAEVLASLTITGQDISRYDTVEFWARSSIALTAGQMAIRLLEGVTVRETMNVPALTADTWTFVRVSLTTPELNTAISVLQAYQVADVAAFYLWIDDLRVVEHDSAVWERIRPHSWMVDQEARDLVLKFTPPYALLKLTGWDRPVLFSAETTTSEVDPEFVVAHATMLALNGASGGRVTDPDERRRLAQFWAVRALEAERKWPILQGIRVVG